MAGRESSRVNPKYKAKYRIRELAAVRARPQKPRRRHDLAQRGGARSLDAAEERPPRGQQRYSDLAILTALTLRLVFHLPLRQTEVSSARCCG